MDYVITIFSLFIAADCETWLTHCLEINSSFYFFLCISTQILFYFLFLTASANQLVKKNDSENILERRRDDFLGEHLSKLFFSRGSTCMAIAIPTPFPLLFPFPCSFTSFPPEVPHLSKIFFLYFQSLNRHLELVDFPWVD